MMQQQYGQYDQINHYGRPTARRKKSLLIGINYEGQAHALKGCRQDVRNMVRALPLHDPMSTEPSCI